MGRLIVIEGLDGSGKSTQLELLPKSLANMGIDCRTVSFPSYESNSSALVKMYLGGEFGEKPDDVNGYAASTFFAVDRYASYKTNWGKYYDNGGTVIAGRYTTSNAVHQTSKLPETDWESFLEWRYEFVYVKIGIPKPDLVIFLDMPTDVSQKLLLKRYDGNETKKDIHERDREYLDHCRNAAIFTAKYSGWKIVPCAKNGEPRSVADIQGDIVTLVKEIL